MTLTLYRPGPQQFVGGSGGSSRQPGGSEAWVRGHHAHLGGSQVRKLGKVDVFYTIYDVLHNFVDFMFIYFHFICRVNVAAAVNVLNTTSKYLDGIRPFINMN